MRLTGSGLCVALSLNLQCVGVQRVACCPSMHCLVRQTALKRSGQLCAALWPLSIIAPQTPCPRLLKTDEQRLHLLHGCAQRRCMLGRLEQHACRVGMPGAQLQLSLAELRQPLLFSPPLQCAVTSSASSPSC